MKTIKVNLEICRKCQHYGIETSFDDGVGCNLSNLPWMAAKRNGKWEVLASFKPPENCPYILEHTVLQDGC